MCHWKSRRESLAALLGLLVILHLPRVVHAEDRNEVQAYLISIHHLYENLEHESALEHISRAKQLARGLDDDVLLSLYEGLIQADLGRQEQSIAAFKAALFLNPNARLPLLVSPKVVRRFESLRKKVKANLAADLAKREAELEKQQIELSVPPVLAPPKQEVQVAVQLAAEPARAASAAAEVSTRAASRSHALLPAIAGGVLLAAGGGTWGLARREQTRLRSGDAALDSFATAQLHAERGQTWQTVSFGLMGAGVVGLGVAVGLYLHGSPAEPVALGVGTDGTSAFVYGRLP